MIVNKSKPNILFLVTKSEIGGAQKWTKEQIEICSHEFNCFLATDKPGWLSENAAAKAIYLNADIYRRLSLSYLFSLYKFVKTNDINLIVASSANAGIYARLIKLLHHNVKVIYVSHGWSAIYNGGKLKAFYIFVERQLAKISDSILCVSTEDYNNAKQIIRIDNRKLHIIVNKIFPIKSTKERNADSSAINILMVARLAPPKRADLLINACKDIDVNLHIIGDGILKNTLQELPIKNVVFHGEVPNFSNFNSYDIFALISDSEGLPISALEAMSAGMPLILSNVGGCAELINNNGMLVKNNINDIKSGIIACLKNLEIFCANSVTLFRSKFDLEQHKDEYINYYKKFITTFNKK